jgi:hypothetical protein
MYTWIVFADDVWMMLQRNDDERTGFQTRVSEFQVLINTLGCLSCVMRVSDDLLIWHWCCSHNSVFLGLAKIAWGWGFCGWLQCFPDIAVGRQVLSNIDQGNGDSLKTFVLDSRIQTSQLGVQNRHFDDEEDRKRNRYNQCFIDNANKLVTPTGPPPCSNCVVSTIWQISVHQHDGHVVECGGSDSVVAATQHQASPQAQWERTSTFVDWCAHYPERNDEIRIVETWCSEKTPVDTLSLIDPSA